MRCASTCSTSRPQFFSAHSVSNSHMLIHKSASFCVAPNTTFSFLRQMFARSRQSTSSDRDEKNTSKTPGGRSATFRVQGSVFSFVFLFFSFFDFHLFDLNCCTISCIISFSKKRTFFWSRLWREGGGGRGCILFGGLFFFVFLCFFDHPPDQKKQMFFFFILFFVFLIVFFMFLFFHLSFFFLRFFSLFVFKGFFTFGQVKGNARDGQWQHQPKFSSL